jgi:hypothetical protein
MAERRQVGELDERDREILNLIVGLYIRSGEPVGSRTISKTMDRRLSSATIRNIMSDLEDAVSSTTTVVIRNWPANCSAFSNKALTLRPWAGSSFTRKRTMILVSRAFTACLL